MTTRDTYQIVKDEDHRRIGVQGVANASDVATTVIFVAVTTGAGSRRRGEIYPAKHVRSLLRALAENRDFLSYQFSNASGLISDAQLDARAEEVFSKIGLEGDEDLLPRIVILFDALREELDTDVAAAALGCGLEQAERLLTKLGEMIASRQIEVPALAKELTP